MVQQVAEAAAASVFENGIEKLPPPIHTVYFLGNKHDRKLSIVMGEVKISSISMPEKHLTLTSSRWVRLMSIRHQINIGLGKSNFMDVQYLIVLTLVITTTYP